MADDSFSNKSSQSDSGELNDDSAAEDSASMKAASDSEAQDASSTDEDNSQADSFDENDSRDESFDENDSEGESLEETDSKDDSLSSDDSEGSTTEEEDENGERDLSGDAADSEDDAPALNSLLKNGEEEQDTFATSAAPWVGAEKKWIQEKSSKAGGSQDDDDRDLLLDDSLETLSSPLNLGRDSSLPPPVMGPHSLPALAMAYDQTPKGMSTEAKLGIVAIVLAVIILLGAVGWWLTGLRTDSEQARIMAEKLSQELSARDQMRAAQEATIAKLEERIQQLTESGTPENQAQVNELKAQIVAAQAEIADIETKPLETTQEIASMRDGMQGKATGEESAPVKALTKQPEGKPQAQSAPKEAEPTAIPSDPYGQSDNTGSEEPEPEPAPTPPPEKKSSSEVDDLIESAITRPTKPDLNTLPQTDPGGMPAVPSREQVKTAMSTVAPSVKKCSDGSGGRIELQISVSGATGRVLDAQPIGSFSGTAVGICAARAVRLAKFPKFSQSNLVIKYPFDL